LPSSPHCKPKREIELLINSAPTENISETAFKLDS
jgi:hypothetical protein